MGHQGLMIEIGDVKSEARRCDQDRIKGESNGAIAPGTP